MSDDEEKKVFMSLLSKKRKLLELREVVMLKSPRNRLLGEKDECCSEILFSNELPSISPPPFSPLTPLIQELRHKNTIEGNELPSISPPPFSPLTPLIQELRHKNTIEGKANSDARRDTSVVMGSSPLLKNLENEDQTSSPIPAMSPETKELYDVLNEKGLEFDDTDDNEIVQYPDLMAKNINNTKEDSETDCESCDDISTPKDTQKKTSDSNKIDNDAMQSTLSVENEAEEQKTKSYIPVEENTQHKTTVSTSDINNMTDTRSEDTPIRTQSEDATEEGIKKKKKGRSRKEREESKRLRNSGKGYVTEKGKKIGERQLSSLSTCRLKCFERFSEIERKQCFDKYWALGSRDRRAMYVASLITILPKKTQKTDARTVSRDYYCKYKLNINNEDKTICKECFCKTYGETKGFVNVVIDKKKNSICGIIPCDMRGCQPPKNKKTIDDTTTAINHILSFPNYESHYCRKRTNRKYLSSDLSIAAMYRMYKEKCTNPVSLKLYSKCFHDLNLSFKKPAKDTCHTCDLLNTKISLAPGQENLDLKAKLAEHQTLAEKAYSEKRKDKENAKHDPSFQAYTFDLQQCLPTPYLKTSVSFYKRQLWSFNLTVHNLADDKATCYMWDETIGARGANQIASCLWHLLQNLPPNIKEVTFYSDTCGGQNKNNIVAMMFMLLLHKHPTLEIINHKFLISGHSHMECDSDHAIIERTKKKTRLKINHLNDWLQLVRSCKIKNAFEVIPMKLVQFYKFSELGSKKGPFTIKKKDVLGNKFLWQPVKWLQFRKPIGEIHFKTDLDRESPFNVISFKKRGKYNLDNVQLEVVSKETLPISQEKKKDLLELLPLIDPAFHDFFRNIKTSTEIENIDPDIDVEDPDVEDNLHQNNNMEE